MMRGTSSSRDAVIVDACRAIVYKEIGMNVGIVVARFRPGIGTARTLAVQHAGKCQKASCYAVAEPGSGIGSGVDNAMRRGSISVGIDGSSHPL